MIICVCEAVNDRAIRSAIHKGCRSVRALRESTGAGGRCGNCACDLKRMLRENQENAASAPGPGSLTALLR